MEDGPTSCQLLTGNVHKCIFIESPPLQAIAHHFEKNISPAPKMQHGMGFCHYLWHTAKTKTYIYAAGSFFPTKKGHCAHVRWRLICHQQLYWNCTNAFIQRLVVRVVMILVAILGHQDVGLFIAAVVPFILPRSTTRCMFGTVGAISPQCLT